MKRDGRSFDHRTLEAIRLMAVERVLAGEPASAVIASYGFNRTTIYKWIKTVSRHGIEVEALRARRATGRPRSELFLDLVAQSVPFAEWGSCHAGPLHVAPDEFVRVQFRGITWQEMKGEKPFRRGHIGFHERRLVGGQTIDHEMHGRHPPPHHFLQQGDEQLRGETSFIGAIPERPPGIHSRRRADRLPLTTGVRPFAPQVFPCAASARNPNSSQK